MWWRSGFLKAPSLVVETKQVITNCSSHSFEGFNLQFVIFQVLQLGHDLLRTGGAQNRCGFHYLPAVRGNFEHRTGSPSQPRPAQLEKIFQSQETIIFHSNNNSFLLFKLQLMDRSISMFYAIVFLLCYAIFQCIFVHNLQMCINPDWSMNKYTK